MISEGFFVVLTDAFSAACSEGPSVVLWTFVLVVPSEVLSRFWALFSGSVVPSSGFGTRVPVSVAVSAFGLDTKSGLPTKVIFSLDTTFVVSWAPVGSSDVVSSCKGLSGVTLTVVPWDANFDRN